MPKLQQDEIEFLQEEQDFLQEEQDFLQRGINPKEFLDKISLCKAKGGVYILKKFSDEDTIIENICEFMAGNVAKLFLEENSPSYEIFNVGGTFYLASEFMENFKSLHSELEEKRSNYTKAGAKYTLTPDQISNIENFARSFVVSLILGDKDIKTANLGEKGRVDFGECLQFFVQDEETEQYTKQSISEALSEDALTTHRYDPSLFTHWSFVSALNTVISEMDTQKIQNIKESISLAIATLSKLTIDKDVLEKIGCSVGLTQNYSLQHIGTAFAARIADRVTECKELSLGLQTIGATKEQLKKYTPLRLSHNYPNP